MGKSIWPKIGVAVKKGGKVLFEEIKYFINPMHWGHSGRRIGHEVKQAFYKAHGQPTEKYDPSIKTIQASKDLGIQIIKQEKGKVSFLASRTLIGDVPYLSLEQLDRIKQELQNVTIFREKNKIVIEVDVKQITNDIKTKHKGKSSEEIKELVLEGIYDEIDRNFKNLAKITGGEFKVHTDRKLLHGIAEKLCQEYDNQKQPSGAKKSTESVNHKRPPEAINSVGKETIIGNGGKKLSNETINWTDTIQGSKQGSERQRG